MDTHLFLAQTKKYHHSELAVFKYFWNVTEQNLTLF